MIKYWPSDSFEPGNLRVPRCESIRRFQRRQRLGGVDVLEDRLSVGQVVYLQLADRLGVLCDQDPRPDVAGDGLNLGKEAARFSASCCARAAALSAR